MCGWVVNATPRPIYPRERPGTRCTGGWVGPRAGLDGCGESRPPPGFDRRTVPPGSSVAVPTELPGAPQAVNCLLSLHLRVTYEALSPSLEKLLFASTLLRFCPSVGLLQLASHWMDFSRCLILVCLFENIISVINQLNAQILVL